jgi:hypothetical protein
MNWYEGVYDTGFDAGSGAGGSAYQDFYGFTATNALNFDSRGGWGGAGGAGGGFPPINIGIGGGGAPRQPNLNQVLTQLVDRYEALLAANLGEFQVGSKDGETAYNYAIRTFDELIAQLVAYGPQGERAASERDRRRNPALLKWDWILYYIEPIFGGSPEVDPQRSRPPRVPGGGPNSPFPSNPELPPAARTQDDNSLYLLAGGALLLVFLAARK